MAGMLACGRLSGDRPEPQAVYDSWRDVKSKRKISSTNLSNDATVT